MPHFGLMDEDQLGPIQALLMRARLHIRGGKRRLQQGKYADGIATLYDAFVSAMQYYIADPAHQAELVILPEDDQHDDKVLFEIFIRSHVIRDTFDFDSFAKLADQALEGSFQEGQALDKLWDALDIAFNELGVTPFDENELPPEDPSTF